MASPALVRVIRGTAYIPVVNVGSTDVLLYPHTAVGTLAEVSVVSLPAGITEVPSGVAIVVSQSFAEPVEAQIDALDLSHLSVEQQVRASSLFQQ